MQKEKDKNHCMIFVFLFSLNQKFTQITLNSSHFPLLNRHVNRIQRKIQSNTIAIQTPIAPHPNQMPKMILNTIRNMNIENMEIHIQNRTSPAARSAFGIVKEVGHKKIAIPS